MYQRIFAVLGVGMLVGCTGCNAVQSIPGKISNQMTGGFTTEITISNADTESKATLTRYGTDAWCVVFSEPQNLSGVQLDFLDDEVTASYKGLAFSVPQSAQAIRTELGNFMDIVDELSLSPELTGKPDEEKIIYEGKIEEGSYTLTFTDKGIPVQFSLPCYGVTVDFTGFTQQSESMTSETTIPETTLPPAT